MGMSGAVDINLTALVWIMERLGVAEDEQLEMSRKVRGFAGLVLEEIHKEQKKVKK